LEKVKSNQWKCDYCDYINIQLESKCQSCFKLNSKREKSASPEKKNLQKSTSKNDLRTSDDKSRDSRRGDKLCTCKRKDGDDTICKYCKGKIMKKTSVKLRYSNDDIRKSIEHHKKSDIIKDYTKRM
jgi:hypothetical protein